MEFDCEKINTVGLHKNHLIDIYSVGKKYMMLSIIAKIRLKA